MAKKRTITITVETDQLLIMRKSHGNRAWCVRCNEQTEYTTSGEPAILTNNKLEQPVNVDPHSLSEAKD